jgi:hypothetical protein
MVKIIDKLTPEQEAKIPDFIAKWVAQASEPTNRIKATKSVKDMYRSMDQKEPIIIFGQSPYATAHMAAPGDYAIYHKTEYDPFKDVVRAVYD